MRNAEITGEICSPQVDFEFDWKIENFSSLSVGHFYRSPKFNFCDYYCNIRLYPKGESVIEMYLVARKPGHPSKFKYSMGIEDVNGESEVWLSDSKTFERSSTVWCKVKCIVRSELQQRKDKVAQTDVLKFTVILKIGTDETLKEGGVKVLQDLKSLWLSGEQSDVVIEVGDVQYKAHRAILAARTPVLSAMFKHGTSEKLSGVVTINDCEPAIFGHFLYFIYTGVLRELSVENASALYAVADKYLVSGVKEQCVRFLQDTLCVNTICDVFTLSLRHNEKKLLETATRFFAKNMVDVMKSFEWKVFMRDNTIWANEVTISALGLEGINGKRPQDSQRHDNRAKKRIRTGT